MREIWRPIPGWCGLYEVSTFGRIRSLDRVTGPVGRARITRGRIMTLVPRQRYATVLLKDKERHQIAYVNRVMLQVFRPVINDVDLDSCHNNGKRTDNSLENLRWDTRMGNLKDMDIHGTRIKGENHPRSKLNESQVRLIKASQKSNKDMAAELNVPAQMVRRVRSGLTWSHIE
jgi:hypothetical protein